MLWLQTDAIAGSPAVINRFTELGKKVYFLTNNSTKTRPEFLKKAHDLGFKMTEEGILSTAWAAAQYLKSINFDKKVFVVGSQGVGKELDNVGIRHTGIGPDVLVGSIADLLSAGVKPDPEVGAVIVAFDEHISYPKLLKAATYLSNPDILFIGTNKDERFPMGSYVIPGTGSIVGAVEICAERKPILIGKPETSIIGPLLSEQGIVPERTLMIGDRGNTDILFGTECGYQTLLVGTGIHNLDNAREWKNGTDSVWSQCVPDVYLPALADLLPYMS